MADNTSTKSTTSTKSSSSSPTVNESAPVPKTARAIAHIESVVYVSCCDGRWKFEAEPIADVPAASGGKELTRAACDLCGSEYLIGVIAKTCEESLAEEVFQHVADDVLDEVMGDDRNDYEPSPDEVKMCAKCDGTAGPGDWCGGCNDYVHGACRTRQPGRPARHQADEHWQEPKFAEVKAVRAEPVDDGGTFDEEDFVAGV